jgi:prepilin-type N-terminal cleavage/methylation domain-containing protein
MIVSIVMSIPTSLARRGFTLIELLVVIAIIGVLSSLFIASLSQSREKGRDAARKSQLQEIFKAIELHYSDAGLYPDDGTPADNTAGDTLTNIGSGLVGGRYLKRLPESPDEYHYCVSANRKSMVLAVNTEQDSGSNNSEYCNVLRGPGPDYGCTTWLNDNALDTCQDRFW